MEWIKCAHKTVLETGEYLIRVERHGNGYNTKFEVNSKEVKKEIPYFFAVAYLKIPEYK